MSAVAGVVLAAGGARRMKGRLKQVLPCHGETLVHRVTRTALEAELSPVWVVVGAGEAAVRAAVSDLPVQCLPNPRWETGQSTSVALAAHQLRAMQAEAAVFLLADQPFVTPALVQRLIAVWRARRAPIVAPRIAQQRSNPVLISAEIFPLLENITGDQGARAYFEQFPPVLVPWHDPRARVTIDTPEDYRQWCPEGAILSQD